MLEKAKKIYNRANDFIRTHQLLIGLIIGLLPFIYTVVIDTIRFSTSEKEKYNERGVNYRPNLKILDTVLIDSIITYNDSMFIRDYMSAHNEALPEVTNYTIPYFADIYFKLGIINKGNSIGKILANSTVINSIDSKFYLEEIKKNSVNWELSDLLINYAIAQSETVWIPSKITIDPDSNNQVIKIHSIIIYENEFEVMFYTYNWLTFRNKIHRDMFISPRVLFNRRFPPARLKHRNISSDFSLLYNQYDSGLMTYYDAVNIYRNMDAAYRRIRESQRLILNN